MAEVATSRTFSAASDQLLVVVDPVARRADGESVRIAKDVIGAGAAGAKVCLPDGPEEFARAIDEAEAETTAMALLRREGSEITALGRAVLQCYYRDERVIRSLGLEPGPPFPKGHTVQQGDWSLLDAVRNRPPMWRDVEDEGR